MLASCVLSLELSLLWSPFWALPLELSPLSSPSRPFFLSSPSFPLHLELKCSLRHYHKYSLKYSLKYFLRSLKVFEFKITCLESVQDHKIMKPFGIISFPLNWFLVVLTRLTVGRVKPFLDLHRLSAHDVIMIPYKVWSGKQFPVSSRKFLYLAWYLGLCHNFWMLDTSLKPYGT